MAKWHVTFTTLDKATLHVDSIDAATLDEAHQKVSALLDHGEVIDERFSDADHRIVVRATNIIQYRIAALDARHHK